MPVKSYKPTSPGQRQRVSNTYEELTKGVRPPKRLRTYRKENAGRNNQGKLTVRHHGAGHKKLSK